MGAALGWGALAASSLLLGVLLGLLRPWSTRPVGLVLALGAGALISAVAFSLALEGVKVGGLGAVAVGLAAGALSYYLLDGVIERSAKRASPAGDAGANAGPALILGAVLDGIPEQLVLGIAVATGGAVSVGLLAAVFVSNLPEAVGSTTDLRAGGHRPVVIWRLWVAVAVVCTAATVTGYAIADTASALLKAAIDGFAAGALLVMLIDSMIPEARAKAGSIAGLATVIGFAVATGLSGVTA